MAHNLPTGASNKPSQQTMSIPKYGAAAPCKPTKPSVASQAGVVKWAFCPNNFSLLDLVLVISLIVILVGVVIAAVSPSAKVVGIILIFVGFIGIPITINWKWNANKQLAYKLARGKSREQVKLWAQADATFAFMAKDPIFETRYGGKLMTVLRDGTIEVQGQHDDIDSGDAMADAMESALSE
jgi:hypothetical protein